MVFLIVIYSAQSKNYNYNVFKIFYALISCVQLAGLISTVEPRYHDIRFSHHFAYHVSFSKSRCTVHDFNANKLRILRQ